MARVLVVDDEQTDQVIMETLLERAGHDVYFAADGEHAFKSYLKNGIEIIITDLNMPHVDRDGAEAAAEKRADTSKRLPDGSDRFSGAPASTSSLR